MSDTIYAEVLCDSINPAGDRLTTFVVEGPRFILAEINTHRWASRNASSSRAIPFKRMIQDLDRNTVYPVRWGRNRPGMQAGGELDLDASQACREEWDLARADAIRHAERLAALGLHKQWVNRLVEPFMVWRGIMSATNWVNFFKLRAHPDAQPEFQILAYRMLHKYLESEPEEMDWGDWHIPYDEHTPEEVRLAQAWRFLSRVSSNSVEGRSASR